MSGAANVLTAIERVIDIFCRRPETARSTSAGTAVVDDGLKATFTAGDVSAVMDMPPIMGGGGEGPTPGFHARAGIAGCVAIGIKMAAVRAGIDLERVTVDVETDFDDGAMFGMGDASAAPLETRLAIYVTTRADEDAVRAMIDTALSQDPWFLALRDAQRAVPTISVAAP